MSLTALATEILEAAKVVDKRLNTFPESSEKNPIESSRSKFFSKRHGRIFRTLRSYLTGRYRGLCSAHKSDERKISEQSTSNSKESIIGGEIDQISSFERYNLMPDDLYSVRDKLINKCNEIRTFVETPETALVNICCNWTELVSLQAICHFRLFEAIPPTGSATYSEIATTANVPEDLAVRFIRIGILNGIFSEPIQGRVFHTPRSRWLLMRGSGLLDLIAFNCSELAPAALRYPETIEKFGAAEEPEHSPFAIANDNLPLFEVLARDDKRRLRFGRSMEYLTSAESYDVRHILNGYDWSSVDKPGNRALDVGGGLGHISALIAAHTNHLHFTVQDLPPVINDAIANKSSIAESHLLDRISFLPLSFFSAHSPSTPAFDVVFLRWILHNWSDKYTKQIFRAMIPILRKGSQVFIIEYLLDEVCCGVNATDSFGLRCDMIMGVGFGAKERTPRDIRVLIDDVAQEFGGHWSNWSVKKPEFSSISFIQVTWEGI